MTSSIEFSAVIRYFHSRSQAQHVRRKALADGQFLIQNHHVIQQQLRNLLLKRSDTFSDRLSNAKTCNR